MVNYKPVQIVDAKDKPIGAASFNEVWQKNLYHRISRVMLENSHGQILLQKRSSDKLSYPDCWDNSAAGYVDENESYAEAARRELSEELGIKHLKLREIGYYYAESFDGQHHFKRFNRVYRGFTDQKPTKLQASELSEVRWYGVDEIKNLIKQQPATVSDGLVQVMERYY